jgi:hypothetical protein
MTTLESVPTGIQRSRRNLIKVGAIAGSAVLASLTTPGLAAAGNGNGQGGNGQGGNGQGGNGQGGPCFLRGTNIRTAGGDKKIEELALGDLLPTVFGGKCPIQWIGRYSLKKSDPTRAWVKKVLPVRVGRSALGLDVPCADLYVTKEHALLIDGVLVTAGSLINGTTISVYDPRELDEFKVLPYQACAPQRDLRGRSSLRNFEELRRDRGQSSRIPSSLWTSNNAGGSVRAFAQLYRRAARNKIAFAQCNLTLD